MAEYTPHIEPSELDKDYYARIRASIAEFMAYAARSYVSEPGRLLDVAPQDHPGARPAFGGFVDIETIDIDPGADCTFTGDICQRNDIIEDGRYTYVVCTAVLEHVLQPFAAIAEIGRLLMPGGLLFLTVPLNFRIHGPLPDCWRFTEHGVRAMLATWQILEMTALESPDRPLMPILYNVVAKNLAPDARSSA